MADPLERFRDLFLGVLSIKSGKIVDESVVLLRGLARSDKSLLMLERVLETLGYNVVNHN